MQADTITYLSTDFFLYTLHLNRIMVPTRP